MSTPILCNRPGSELLSRNLNNISSALYTKPCRILKIEFKNLRVRNEEKIDRLLVETLNCIYHLGSITAQQIHQIFGIGVALARSEMQKMWVRGLIMSGPQTTKFEDFKGFKFTMEQTKRNKDSEFDRPFSLTEEGKRIITEGKFERIQGVNEILYFIEPSGLMLPRGTSLQDQQWILTSEFPIEDIKGWFEGDQRIKRGIPDIIYGISLKEEKKLDDFLNIERVIGPTQSELSYATPDEFGVWFVQIMKPDNINPISYPIEKVGIWYDNKFHDCELDCTHSIRGGMLGKEWRIISAQGIKNLEAIKKCIKEKDRMYIEIEMDNPPRHWIPSVNKAQLAVEAIEPGNESGRLRFYAIPIPTKNSLISWIHAAMKEVEFQNDQPITYELVKSSLMNLERELIEYWIHGDNRTHALKIIKENLTVNSYIDYERLRGNWLIKYRLDEKEVFSNAI